MSCCWWAACQAPTLTGRPQWETWGPVNGPQQRPFHSGGHSGAQNEVGVAACALRHTERAKPLVTLNIHSLSFVNNYFLKSTFKISPWTRKFEMLWNLIGHRWKKFWSRVFPSLVTNLSVYMILPKTNCEPERNFPKQSKNRRNLIHHAKKSLSYLDSPLYKEVLLSKYCHIKSIQSNQRVNSQKSNIQVWEFFVILVVFVSFLKCVNCSPGGVAQSISALSREVLQGCRPHTRISQWMHHYVEQQSNISLSPHKIAQ